MFLINYKINANYYKNRLNEMENIIHFGNNYFKNNFSQHNKFNYNLRIMNGKRYKKLKETLTIKKFQLLIILYLFH